MWSGAPPYCNTTRSVRARPASLHRSSSFCDDPRTPSTSTMRSFSPTASEPLPAFHSATGPGQISRMTRLAPAGVWRKSSPSAGCLCRSMEMGISLGLETSRVHSAPSPWNVESISWALPRTPLATVMRSFTLTACFGCASFHARTAPPRTPTTTRETPSRTSVSSPRAAAPAAPPPRSSATEKAEPGSSSSSYSSPSSKLQGRAQRAVLGAAPQTASPSSSESRVSASDDVLKHNGLWWPCGWFSPKASMTHSLSLRLAAQQHAGNIVPVRGPPARGP
mmetsp:Transcript_59814/g.157250  ORF Transcript_59814/g.157250 Transcript_59814/m.157250 type:complete len:279 (+) Transcript_59814:125-961(+)